MTEELLKFVAKTLSGIALFHNIAVTKFRQNKRDSCTQVFVTTEWNREKEITRSELIRMSFILRLNDRASVIIRKDGIMGETLTSGKMHTSGRIFREKRMVWFGHVQRRDKDEATKWIYDSRWKAKSRQTKAEMARTGERG